MDEQISQEHIELMLQVAEEQSLIRAAEARKVREECEDLIAARKVMVLNCLRDWLMSSRYDEESPIINDQRKRSILPDDSPLKEAIIKKAKQIIEEL